MKTKIYLVSAISKATPAFKEKVARVRKFLKERLNDCEILDYYGTGTDVTDGQVVEFDLRLVVKADLILIIADEETWGGGMEFGIALAIGKPILIIAPSEWKKTRMLTGSAELLREQVKFEVTHAFSTSVSEEEAFLVHIRFAIEDFKLHSPREEIRRMEQKRSLELLCFLEKLAKSSSPA